MKKRSASLTPIRDASVAHAFSAYPASARRRLLDVRALIFATAASIPEVGELTEALRWGEPAYVTAESQSGSTIRLGWRKLEPEWVAIYFHCQTNLIASFRELFGDSLRLEGNRAILIRISDSLPKRALKVCIARALTYRRKRRRADSVR